MRGSYEFRKDVIIVIRITITLANFTVIMANNFTTTILATRTDEWMINVTDIVSHKQYSKNCY